MSILLPVRQLRPRMTKTTPFDEQTAEYDAWFEHHKDLYQTELEAM